MTSFQTELEEMVGEARLSEEKAKKAMMDAARYVMQFNLLFLLL